LNCYQIYEVLQSDEITSYKAIANLQLVVPPLGISNKSGKTLKSISGMYFCLDLFLEGILIVCFAVIQLVFRSGV